MSKKITNKEILQAAASMKASKFMKLYGESDQIEIYDADNILDYNDGFLNLKFHGTGSTDYEILFVDGTYESITAYDNAGC